MNAASEFDACAAALRKGLSERFGLEPLQPFGHDTPNPGIKADFDLAAVGVHLALWRNCSFDLEALDLISGDLVLRRSVGDATPSDIDEALDRLDAWSDPNKRARHRVEFGIERRERLISGQLRVIGRVYSGTVNLRTRFIEAYIRRIERDGEYFRTLSADGISTLSLAVRRIQVFDQDRDEVGRGYSAALWLEGLGGESLTEGVVIGGGPPSA